ncbi:glycosyltransferase family 59 protein [Periconia macrospinosa]|uniref:Dol-P-Glc:Glc(2)Man(9)GlcNAc(2)-PP-Dol alpha-1,2-glucosyltransferase n=1 Tax=Periconia macrospinosa TaxID=97972 RepID=A0A2V1EB11_9PLEO|nr:glycosyltransferase family 59 protein [Periconia macrospinosa]
MNSSLQVWALPAALLATASIAMTWYNLVTKHVPDPYLDEFFHVPQAQRYCRNDFTWDPKITTPPGLQVYLVSLLIKNVAGCETSNLRALNVAAICLVCILSYNILVALHKGLPERTEQVKGNTSQSIDTLNAHSALNISLFPPLFFFSALYYTDVMSTLVVLLSYLAFLNRDKTSYRFLSKTGTIIIGVLALLFRQTNIFWVAIFPAAMAVVDVFGGKQQTGSFEKKDLKYVCEQSWSYGRLYDCSVESAEPHDFLLFAMSLALVILAQPILLLKTVIPYLILIALFAGFVIWNGSVVLGDKSAHTATLHLPQMLYFWPYVALFSTPLVVSSLLSHIASLLPAGLSASLESLFDARAKKAFPSLVAASMFILPGLAMVHFNTIIHPYTLADNRHYVFYVFRIIRRHPAIKYAAVPFYYICAWTVFHTLSTKPERGTPTKQNAQKKSLANNYAQPQSRNISFVVAWVGTTALSVATAPLVEPRYFIIPWIIWRLHVPYLSKARASNKGQSYDLRLVLETVWLLVMNATLGYNFLYRGFSWPQEPGKVQRFLW